jgi:hypothetical protein
MCDVRSADDPLLYEQTTNDLEVDRMPALLSWLNRVQFIAWLQVGTQL